MDTFDVSSVIQPGVYVLRSRGRVVFVGAAKKPLVRIYAHANFRAGEPAPAWLPTKPMQFDSVEIRPCRVDELETALADVIAELGWVPASRAHPIIDWPRVTAHG